MKGVVKSLKVAPELFYFWLLQISATGSPFLSSLHFIHVSEIVISLDMLGETSPRYEFGAASESRAPTLFYFQPENILRSYSNFSTSYGRLTVLKTL